METPHLNIHSQKHLASAKIILETLAYHQAIFTIENLFGPFSTTVEGKRSSLELGATDIGSAQRTPPTSSLEVILIKKLPLYIALLFLLHVLYFYCFSLVFISVYFSLHH